MWKPKEAAAFRAASAPAFLREIAPDGRALRGVHRLLSIAERRGGEVTFAGVKFSGLQPQAGQQWLRERESVLNEHTTTNGENAGSSAASVQGHQRPQRTRRWRPRKRLPPANPRQWALRERALADNLAHHRRGHQRRSSGGPVSPNALASRRGRRGRR